LGRIAGESRISVLRLRLWTDKTWNRALTTVNILLVGKDEKDHVAHFTILDNAAEFGFGFFHASAVA
jgi:hypothetical protein